MSKLKGSTIEISKLSDIDRSQLLDLFVSYYDGVCSKTFFSDLSNKDKIILLRERKSNDIKGFSTLKKIKVELDDQSVFALFSGDTIVDSDFWGQSALSIQFVKNLVVYKLLHPRDPLYWFLICKGFKTYLLLTKNFDTYYPRFDQETPENIFQLIDRLAFKFYPHDYNKATKVIELSGKSYKLKEDIAPIGPQEMKNPHINFFNKKNPGWTEGDELCCVGLFNIKAVSLYFNIIVKKTVKYFK